MSDTSFPLWLVEMQLNDADYPETRGPLRMRVVPSAVVEVATRSAAMIGLCMGLERPLDESARLIVDIFSERDWYGHNPPDELNEYLVEKYAEGWPHLAEDAVLDWNNAWDARHVLRMAGGFAASVWHGVMSPAQSGDDFDAYADTLHTLDGVTTRDLADEGERLFDSYESSSGNLATPPDILVDFMRAVRAGGE